MEIHKPSCRAIIWICDSERLQQGWLAWSVADSKGRGAWLSLPYPLPQVRQLSSPLRASVSLPVKYEISYHYLSAYDVPNTTSELSISFPFSELKKLEFRGYKSPTHGTQLIGVSIKIHVSL